MKRDICKKEKRTVNFAGKFALEVLFEGCLNMDERIGSS